MGSDFSLEDVMIIFRRRLKYFLIPAVILAPLMVIGVMLLPAQYTSTGTLLIQSSQISDRLVQEANDASALERIEVIKQRIIVRPELLQIATDTDLFPAWRNLSDTKKVKRMKKRFEVLPVTSGFQAGSEKNTFAFKVSYTDPSPEKAEVLANVFINKFQTFDRSQSVKGATESTQFFENQANKIEEELNIKQREIAQFKQENNGSLPQQLVANERALERRLTQINNIDQQISAIEDDKRLVQSQMANNAGGGGDENSPEARLRALKGALAEERSNYTDSHPVVQALLGQIQALERQLAPGRDLQDLQQRLDRADDALTEAQKAGASEEEIDRLNGEVDRLFEQFLAKANSAGGLSSSAQNNLLQSSLLSLQKRARGLEERRRAHQEFANELEDKITKTPGVESLLSELEREEDVLTAKHEEVIAKQFNAETSESLQVEDRAERIRTIEAAALPEKPSSPNRPALIFLSLIFSILIGVAVALAAEFLNPTIRGRSHLTSILEEPPIASIPYIAGDDEQGMTLPFIGGKKHAGNKKGSGNVDDGDLGVAA